MAPYENQLIGAFVYALGFEVARRAAARGDDPGAAAMPVNLFQQTPLDAAFSDLVLGRERCVVIEFKRSLEALATEQGKDRAPLRAALAADQAFRQASMLAHHVVYASLASGDVDLRGCLYLDVLGLTKPPKLDRGPARAMIHHLADPASTLTFGLPGDAMGRYLDRLRRLRAEAVGTGGRRASEAWLGIARGGDGLRIVTAPSLDALLGLDRDAAPVRDADLHDLAPARGGGPER